MITRKEQEVRRLRQIVMNDPIPPGPAPALAWLIEHGRFDGQHPTPPRLPTERIQVLLDTWQLGDVA